MNMGMELWERAQALHLQDKFDEAEKIYVALLEQNHDKPALMAALGSLYSQKQNAQMGLSIHFLQAAVEKMGHIPDVWTNLGIAYLRAQRREEARKAFEKSLSVEETASALVNFSGMFIESGQDERCIELCEKAIRLEPESPIAHWNLSISLLANGHWERGWKEYDWGIKARDDSASTIRENRVILDVPLWDGTPGKTVLIYGEQGIGDEIMFASMLPDLLKTNKVVFECSNRLEKLFKLAFPGMPIYGTRYETAVAWANDHQIDYRLPIGGLGTHFRNKRSYFPGTPYLKAEPLERAAKFRVGIAWSGGGAKKGRVQKRSVPLAWWKSILGVNDVEFVSLQHTEDKEELDAMEAQGYSIKRFDEVKAQDYYETARVVASCDLVISVCQSVIHLAGALGVPCWVMVPKFPAWRYQNTGGMPWYRSVRLYRSPEPSQDGWPSVVAKIGYDLEELMKSRNKLQAVA